ncbi:hypothetical protein TWF718_001632 [Orbilia javanica]|uniref:Opsin n=1 Tax=Orbilia javanica TaxID=47235 RepID=A0AAN8N1L6_9PEZI
MLRHYFADIYLLYLQSRLDVYEGPSGSLKNTKKSPIPRTMGDYYHQAGGKTPPGPIPDPTSTAPAIPLPTVTQTPPVFEHITEAGQRTLWVLFVLMLISTLALVALSWKVPIAKRLFFQVTTYVTLISTFTYYAMATGGGWDYHHIWVSNEHKHDIPDTHSVVLRQIFWVRYVDWVLTTPLVLFNLCALAGLSGSNILNVIVASTAMNFTGFFTIYSYGSSNKWGWYTMSWIAFLTVGRNLLINGRAKAQSRGVQLLYNPTSVYTVIVWIGYRVILGVSDFSGGISPDETVVVFAILDILAKPALGFWLVLGHQKSNSQVELDGVWTEGFGHREGAIRVGEGAGGGEA